MKNIILIGMPGAGKSTIGVLLAKSLLMTFTDTDLIIQSEYGKSLCSIIDEMGTDKFLEAENHIIAAQNFTNSVVATGGSAVFGKTAMEKLKNSGTVVYLKLDVDIIEKRINNIKSRGVVMTRDETISDIYNERRILYEKYADVTVDCNSLSPEQCVEAIIKQRQTV